YTNIDKKKGLTIALMFGLMQALMPLLGYWLVEGISQIVGAAGGEQAGKIMALVVTWISFAALLIIGGKMLIEGIINLKKPKEEKVLKLYSFKEVFIMSIATAIDALAVGVSFHAGISTTSTIWLHVVIIMVTTFIISLLGVFLGKFFEKLLKGKYDVSSIIAGVILIVLAVWIVLSHYLGI
ncbi:MAG: manganese efflux pump, partial [Bacilli bacterium]|nr:manganese efflux pump [Bacilli bacterium]